MKISPKVLTTLIEPIFYLEAHSTIPIDATTLDVWVLDHLRSLLQNATTDSTLNSQLRSEKVIFFLHLLGLDTTGHSYRPHSQVTGLYFYFYS